MCKTSGTTGKTQNNSRQQTELQEMWDSQRITRLLPMVNTMIQRIASVTPLPDYCLFVRFEDGSRVVYDVKEDMDFPGYRALREICGLFQQVQLDASRTCVFWNDEIDLPSDAIYQYGRAVPGE